MALAISFQSMNIYSTPHLLPHEKYVSIAWSRAQYGSSHVCLIHPCMPSMVHLLSSFSCSVVSDALWPHGLQHTRPPCPSLFPRICSNSCPLSQWCHPTILASAACFSFCPQSFPASGSFPMSQLSHQMAKVLELQLQHPFFQWILEGLISFRIDWFVLLSKGLSRIFSSITIQKHQFFSVQPSSGSNSHIHTWLLENHSFDYMHLCWQSDVSVFEYAV